MVGAFPEEVSTTRVLKGAFHVKEGEWEMQNVVKGGGRKLVGK